MTPSPPQSPESNPSSPPTSSPSNPTFHDTETPRPRFAQGLPPISHPAFHQHSLPPISHAMGAAGPTRPTTMPDVWPPSRTPPRLSRQKSDESNRPSSSGSSQQAMEEDNAAGPEQGAGPSTGALGDPEPAGPHQRKKRTRTLTTPHQSAVLHALLAQSRFPTTAMREEVGRSIGLSARKVQVWFQNQRQKARKPRTQSTAPVSRPPQFGPFPSAANPESHPVAEGSGPSGSFQGGPSDVLPPLTYGLEQAPGAVHPRGLPAPHQGMPQQPHHFPEFQGYYPSRQPMQQYPPPGMGYSTEPGPSSTTRGGARGYTPPFRYNLPPGPPYGLQGPYPPDPYPHHPMQEQHATRSSEPPIMLPPLRFDQPRGSQARTTLPPPPIHGVDTHFPSDTTRRASFQSSISPSSSSHIPSPLDLSQPLSRHSEGIPPPFTLQPQPQWSPTNPITRPTPPLPSPASLSQGPYAPREHSRHHRTSSDPTRSLPPLSMLVEQEHLPARDQPLITQPWRRPSLPSPTSVPSSAGSGAGTSGRRFDPVHSAIHEGDHGGSSGRTVEGEGNSSRRHRHTWDFARPSRSLASPSPPHRPDDADAHGDQDRQSE